MSDFFELFQAQESRVAARETQRENAPRLAFSGHKQNSTGIGSFRMPNPIRFDVVFLTEPVFSSGGALISLLGDGVDPPMINAVVWQWLRSEKEHYVGAYMHLFVQPFGFNYEGLDKVRVQHSLSFYGVGYKDLGSRVSNEAQMLTTRPVGFGGV